MKDSYRPLGRYTDPSTGLIYLRARYYDPTTAQFLTLDPALTTTHQPYTYASNNPLTNIDPLGLTWWNPGSWTGKTWATVGGVALGVLAAATGVGAIVEGATAAGVLLGVVSTTAGAGAAALDYSPCVNGRDRVACAGLLLGAGGAIAGGAGVAGAVLTAGDIIAEESLSASILNGVGAGGMSVGLGGTAIDAGAGIRGALYPCLPPR